MAGAGLFQMAPYQWTDAAGLSMEGLKLSGQMAASMDKKIKQTTTKKESGGSGLGGALGSVLGTVGGAALGSIFPGVGTALGASIGGSLGGGIGGAIDGGSAGAAAGIAGGFGLGASAGTSNIFDNMFGAISGQKASSNGRAGSAGSGTRWDNGYNGVSIGDSYKLSWSGFGGLLK